MKIQFIPFTPNYMNKAITITLNGVIFNIEEDAYQRLSAYLEDIGRHLGDSGERQEIMPDIEASIAEKFSEKIKAGKMAITLADIEELISVLGSGQDFDNELDADKTQTKTPRKLYRNSDDAIIAGVCSGIAAYFNVAPTWIRLLFFISVFFGGAGILVYGILWIVVPEAKTNAQKLEMKGNPVTFATIEQAVKKNLEELNNPERQAKLRSVFRRLIEFPFLVIKTIFIGIGKFLRALGPIISVLIGLVILLVSLGGFAATSLSAGIALFNIQSPYFISDIPIADLAAEAGFKAAIGGLYLLIVIPIILALIAAVSLLRRRNAFTITIISVCIGVWMAALVVAGVAGFPYIPRIQERVQQYESQAQTTKSFPLANFTSISASDNVHITIEPGAKFTITAAGSQTEVDRLAAAVKDNQLTLTKQPRADRSGLCLICLGRDNLTVTVTMPKLDAYTGTDATVLTAAGFSGDLLKLRLEDAARADITGTYKKLQLDMRDATRLIITGNGTAESLEAQLQDVARLDASNFIVNAATLKLSDATHAEIFAEKNLTVSLSDVARLSYHGNPRVSRTDRSEISPAARLIKLDNAPESQYQEEQEEYE